MTVPGQRQYPANSNHPGILVKSGSSIVTSSLTSCTCSSGNFFPFFLPLFLIFFFLSKTFSVFEVSSCSFCVTSFSLFSLAASISKPSEMIFIATIIIAPLTMYQTMGSATHVSHTILYPSTKAVLAKPLTLLLTANIM